jgi:hypothetical protein
MPGPNGSRIRKGAQGNCSYCNRPHKRGKRNDSCKGHAVRVRIPPPVLEAESGRAKKNKRGCNKGILADRKHARRVEAEARREKRDNIPHHHQLAVLRRRPGNSTRERRRLKKLVERRRRA